MASFTIYGRAAAQTFEFADVDACDALVLNDTLCAQAVAVEVWDVGAGK